MASQSHRICVADSTASRPLKQVGSSVNPSLKRCPLRWQCPVNSPVTYYTSIIPWRQRLYTHIQKLGYIAGLKLSWKWAKKAEGNLERVNMYSSKYGGVSSPERTLRTESEFAYTRLFRVVGSVMACTLLNLLEKMVEVATQSAAFNILETNIDRVAGVLHTT
jgi:hypothetical protein